MLNSKGQNRIDMNRPNIMTYHPTGVKVFMYYDKPGVYFDIQENELPEAFAQGADFDVKKMKQLAKLKVDRELLQRAVAEAMSAEDREVVEKRATYTLISIGNGLFHIEKNEDGERISAMPLNEVVARVSFDQLDPKGEEEADEPVLFGAAHGKA